MESFDGSQDTQSESQSSIHSEMSSDCEEKELKYPIIDQAIGEIYQEGMSVKEIRKAIVKKIIYYEKIHTMMDDDELIQNIRADVDIAECDNPKENRKICLKMEMDKRKALLKKEIKDWMTRNTHGDESSDEDENASQIMGPHKFAIDYNRKH